MGQAKPPVGLLYTPLDAAMLRTPLLPIEAYRGLRGFGEQLALFRDPRVRRAVAAGSLSLLGALDKLEGSALTRREAERAKAKLLRYQIRMSTRPTPYGLFAGCAILPFGTRTDARVLTTFGRSRTRPDMGWLIDLVTEAETDAAIRRQLRWTRNPLARIEGDRVSLSASAPAGSGSTSQPVSVRATPVVRRALELAAHPIEYSRLAAELQRASAFATPAKVEQLLSELWKQTFLLTDLRPPLTIDSPARYVLDRLSSIDAAQPIAARLAACLDAAAAWDRAPHQESDAAFRAVLRTAGRPEDGSKDPPVQVDLGIAVSGRLSGAIAEEAARAAELLLRLSPSPRGLGSMAAYRNAFVARYGAEREVPLLELLDPDRGLGHPSSHGHAHVGPEPSVAEARSRALLQLACTALHNRTRAVSLDEATLARISTGPLDDRAAPVSLDINVLVSATSSSAIDAGDFTLVVGPNLGGWAAGRNFGRFADLFGGEHGGDLIRRAAALEQERHDPECLRVELVFLPANVRSANVAVRPAVRSHEIVFGVSPGVPDACVIPLEALVVGVAGSRLRVRWPAANRVLRVVAGHMLSHHGAPPVAQFLIDAGFDGVIPFTSFDWGPAEGFPFLPRVQVGRVVLRPAEWNLSKDLADPARDGSIGDWRRQWDVPRDVALAVADNRLVLDLDLPDQLQQLRTDLALLPDGRSLVIQELLPAFDDVWLTGEEGHYYSELIVPLVRRPRGGAREAKKQTIVGENVAAAVDVRAGADHAPSPAATPSRRLYPPGSEWLFAKLYIAPHRQDAVIASSLPAFGANAVAAGLAEAWFFIRYADPDPHLRVRFHGTPDRLTRQLFGQVCRWAEGLIADGTCAKIVFDTYDAEVERYGGPEGTVEAERLFCADSPAAARIVGLLQSKAWSNDDERMMLMALTIDDLLRATGLDAAECLAWYERETGAHSRDNGETYRRCKDGLRKAIDAPQAWLRERPGGEALDAMLAARGRELAGIAARLRSLESGKLLTKSLDVLRTSYVHLHVNRIGAAPRERMLIDLLRRTRASLRRSPLESARTAAP
jgi:thiopeptide-type bacteriocin biosynthesis protein